VRLLIVDDSCSFRRAARLLLERRGYEVVGEAGSVDAAVARAAELRPNAALIDIGLPDGSGFYLAAKLKARLPLIAILLTSTDDDGTSHARAEANGAAGFVLKSDLAGCDLSRFFSPRPAARPTPSLLRRPRRRPDR
jgi:DNA-binding NarL/FixJ family response regulator